MNERERNEHEYEESGLGHRGPGHRPQRHGRWRRLRLGEGGSGADAKVSAGSVKISVADNDGGTTATGTITISGGAVEHTFNGYRLGYLTSIAHGDIDDAESAGMTGYTLETNQDYLTQIDAALGGVTVDGETLLTKYKTDKNYCGSECTGGVATGTPNPLGWFFENYGSGYESTANWGGGAKGDASDASVLRQFATKVSAELGKTSAPTATYSGDKALKSSQKGVSNDVTPGYYLLRDTTTIAAGSDTKEDANKETQSAPILVSSTYKVTIGKTEVTFTKDGKTSDGAADGKTLGQVELKNSTPTITKEVVTDTTGATAQNQPDYAVGDTVYYKLTAILPYYTGYAANAADPSTGRVYKITDTASKGLTVDANTAVESVKVTLGDTTQNLVKDKDYTVATANSADTGGKYSGGKTTTIDFANYVNLKEQSTSAKTGGKILEGGTITVIFKATLNSNALISDHDNMKGNPNKDSLTYSNQPENVQETHITPGDEVNVYTYRFRLHKTSKNGDALAGAKFVVSAPGETNKWLKWDTDNNKWGSANSEADATVFTSNTKGEVVAIVGSATVNLDRLDSGTYTVKETEAPENYTQSFLPTFTFTITPTAGSEAEGHKTITQVAFSDKTTVNNGYVTDAFAITAEGDNKGAWQYTIYNAKNLTELPMTGGAGLVAIIAVGVLLAGAGTAAAVRSRKSTSRAVRI